MGPRAGNMGWRTVGGGKEAGMGRRGWGVGRTGDKGEWGRRYGAKGPRAPQTPADDGGRCCRAKDSRVCRCPHPGVSHFARGGGEFYGVLWQRRGRQRPLGVTAWISGGGVGFALRFAMGGRRRGGFFGTASGLILPNAQQLLGWRSAPGVTTVGWGAPEMRPHCNPGGGAAVWQRHLRVAPGGPHPVLKAAALFLRGALPLSVPSATTRWGGGVGGASPPR